MSVALMYRISGDMKRIWMPERARIEQVMKNNDADYLFLKKGGSGRQQCERESQIIPNRVEPAVHPQRQRRVNGT